MTKRKPSAPRSSAQDAASLRNFAIFRIRGMKQTLFSFQPYLTTATFGELFKAVLRAQEEIEPSPEEKQHVSKE